MSKLAESMIGDSLMERAMRLADKRKWAVFPLAPRSKVPVVSEAEGGRGCLDATTDLYTIREWWDRWPAANVGVATGAVSRVWVLDIDASAPKGGGLAGPAALAQLEALHGPIPPTLTSSTGGGGEHRFFRWPVDREVKNRARIKVGGVAAGLDARGTGGYVAAPPSVHPGKCSTCRRDLAWAGDRPSCHAGHGVDGVSAAGLRSYAWTGTAVEVAEAPGWLLDLVAPGKADRQAAAVPVVAPSSPGSFRWARYGQAALDGARHKIAGAPEGARHDAILTSATWLYRLVAGGVLAEADVEALITAAGMAAGKDAREVRRALEWGREKGMAEPYVPADREMAPRVTRGPWPGSEGPPPWRFEDGGEWVPGDAAPPVEDGYAEALAGAHGPAREGADDSGRDRIVVAREALQAALETLGADQTTQEDRSRVAVRLSSVVPELAVLAHAHPGEWSVACVGLGACAGFGGHLTRLARAVRESADLVGQVERAARRTARGADDTGADPDVAERLARTQEGNAKSSYANLCRVLGEDPRWADLRLNDYGEEVERGAGVFPEAAGTAQAAIWLSDTYGIDAAEGPLKSAIHAVASGRRYNPVTTYLDSIRGAHGEGGHIRRVLPDILGIRDAEPMHVAMVARWLVGAVARAYRPGCKMDTMLVLVGRQGRKKSTFFAALGGEWYADSPLDIGNKDAPIVMSGYWIYELAELDGITSQREAADIKSYMSISRDTYRAPYARAASRHPRRGVLCGSVNVASFLSDPTGNRRFHVLTVPDDWIVPVDVLRERRDAIWAEALACFEAGDRWWFEADEDSLREEDAQQYVEEDPWQDAVERWIRTEAALAGAFTSARVMESALKLDPAQANRAGQRRVVAILRRLGYASHASPAGYRGSRVWLKTT